MIILLQTDFPFGLLAEEGLEEEEQAVGDDDPMDEEMGAARGGEPKSPGREQVVKRKAPGSGRRGADAKRT